MKGKRTATGLADAAQRRDLPQRRDLLALQPVPQRMAALEHRLLARRL